MNIISQDPRDAEMVQSPWDWPLFPILPLKHKIESAPDGSGRRMGFILAGEGPKLRHCLTVFLVKDFQECQVTKYHSWEALLEDWTVD